MATRAKKAVAPEKGRKGAYVLRNRAALLKSTQEILANIGPSATIDEVAEHAQMSVSTIYKHFNNKEILFTAALLTAFADWEQWQQEILKSFKDELELLVIPMRLFVRMKTTHPHYAEMVSKNFESISLIVPQLASEMGLHVGRLVKSKVLQIDDVELRVQNLAAILAESLRSKLMNPKYSAQDAEKSIRIGLELLGISQAKINKLFEIKLPI
jgi:AcrR family transcriptional regulator